MSRAGAAIVGVGMSKFQTRRNDCDFTGLVQEATEAALTDSGLTMKDIDLVVYAQAPDAMYGLGHPEYSVTGRLGAAGKPVIRVNTGGATGSSAVEVAWWAALTGKYRHVLAVGAEKMGDSTGGAQETLNKIWDPPYESALPLNTIAMTALLNVRYMDQQGAVPEQFAEVASRHRENGKRNENAHLRKSVTPEEVMAGPLLYWPIRRDMSCPRSSGGCAVIVSSREEATKLSSPKAWIGGIGACTNTYFMGDKMGDAGDNDHGKQPDVRIAAEKAYRLAGIDRPAEQIDLVEPYIPFSSVEPSAVEALGLCEAGEAGRLAEKGHWAFGGKVVVCPSGGVLCSNPISVSAMVRVAEAAQQVRGLAGGHQVDGARTAVSTGAGGSHQFSVVSVLRDREMAS